MINTIGTEFQVYFNRTPLTEKMKTLSSFAQAQRACFFFNFLTFDQRGPRLLKASGCGWITVDKQHSTKTFQLEIHLYPLPPSTKRQTRCLFPTDSSNEIDTMYAGPWLDGQLMFSTNSDPCLCMEHRRHNLTIDWLISMTEAISMMRQGVPVLSCLFLSVAQNI